MPDNPITSQIEQFQKVAAEFQQKRNQDFIELVKRISDLSDPPCEGLVKSVEENGIPKTVYLAKDVPIIIGRVLAYYTEVKVYPYESPLNPNTIFFDFHGYDEASIKEFYEHESPNIDKTEYLWLGLFSPTYRY